MGLFDIFRKNKETKKEAEVKKDVTDMSWKELRAVIGEISDQNTLFEIAAKAPSAMDDPHRPRCGDPCFYPDDLLSGRPRADHSRLRRHGG